MVGARRTSWLFFVFLWEYDHDGVLVMMWTEEFEEKDSTDRLKRKGRQFFEERPRFWCFREHVTRTKLVLRAAEAFAGRRSSCRMERFQDLQVDKIPLDHDHVWLARGTYNSTVQSSGGVW